MHPIIRTAAQLGTAVGFILVVIAGCDADQSAPGSDAGGMDASSGTGGMGGGGTGGSGGTGCSSQYCYGGTGGTAGGDQDAGPSCWRSHAFQGVQISPLEFLVTNADVWSDAAAFDLCGAWDASDLSSDCAGDRIVARIRIQSPLVEATVYLPFASVTIEHRWPHEVVDETCECLDRIDEPLMLTTAQVGLTPHPDGTVTFSIRTSDLPMSPDGWFGVITERCE
jgi:hypothetical protein